MTDDGRAKFIVRPHTRVAEFLTSNRAVDVLEGPLGSGKTKALCVRIMRHVQEQAPSPKNGIRYSRFAMVRNTMPDLKRTTIRSWLELFPENLYGRFIWGAVMQHRIKFESPLGGQIDCEVDFLALDKDEDVRRLRSTEYTGVAFNELAFIEKVLFDEARSRLRYPPAEHGGPTWRGVIADTNAPDEDHWLAIMTGRAEMPSGLSAREQEQWAWPSEWGHLMQPAALIEKRDQHGNVVGYTVNPKAENLENLPDGYYSEQLAGMDKAWIDSRLMCRVVIVASGSPVWPMFRRELHVAREPLKPVPEHDVLVWLDFGRVYPAALFAQEVNQRIYVQHEILGYNEPATMFAPRVKRFLETTYAGHGFRCVGDPKGRDKGVQTEQSSYDVFKSFGMPVSPAPVVLNDIATRTEAVAYALNDNPSGVSRLLISPRCTILIAGMSGRYHLVKEEDGVLRPKKDKYSNLCDCLQYGCLSLGEGRRMVNLKPLTELRGIRVAKERRSMRRVA